MRKLALLLIGFGFLLIAFLLLSGAMVAGLAMLFDLWLALLVAAAIMLSIAGLCLFLLVGRNRSVGNQPQPKSPEGAAMDAGAALGAAMKTRPKTSLVAAFLTGALLGANPGLRRDVIAFARALLDVTARDKKD